MARRNVRSGIQPAHGWSVKLRKHPDYVASSKENFLYGPRPWRGTDYTQQSSTLLICVGYLILTILSPNECSEALAVRCQDTAGREGLVSWTARLCPGLDGPFMGCWRNRFDNLTLTA